MKEKKKKPDAAATVPGSMSKPEPTGNLTMNVSHTQTAATSGNITSLTFQFKGHDGYITVYGRDAWALDQLLRAGADGCTPITNPAPRWSHYIWKLRGQDIHIETVDERHGGTYSWSHARYVLRSDLVLVRATHYGENLAAAMLPSKKLRRAA